LGELEEIQLTGMMQVVGKLKTGRRFIKTGIMILNKKFSHTVTNRATAAFSVFDIVSRPTACELRCIYDLAVTSYFQHLISNRSVGKVTEDIRNKWYEAKPLC
jgi:hypothetical protein